MTKEMVLFESGDGKVSLPVPMDGNTVWLSQQQMAELFGKDRTVIAKHIKNAIEEGEIDPKVVCANFAHTTRHGAMSDKVQHHEIACYNLDVVISVGYRVHSPRGVEFRRWATSVLKDYLIRANQKTASSAIGGRGVFHSVFRDGRSFHEFVMISG